MGLPPGANYSSGLASVRRVVLSSRGFMLTHRIREGALYVFVLVAFGASELLGRALGIRFAAETLGTLYQYLDPSILQDDLLRGIYYLHAQPPLFNVFLGIVVKAFPQSYPAVFPFSSARWRSAFFSGWRGSCADSESPT